MVITGLTRNFLVNCQFHPLKNPVKSRFCRVRKIEYFVVLSVSSFQNLFLSKKVPERRRLAYTETYRSGHNGTDSKTFKYLRTENAEKPLALRFSGIALLLKHPRF